MRLSLLAIAIVMVDQYVTVCEILTVEMCMTLTLTFKMGRCEI